MDIWPFFLFFFSPSLGYVLDLGQWCLTPSVDTNVSSHAYLTYPLTASQTSGGINVCMQKSKKKVERSDDGSMVQARVVFLFEMQGNCVCASSLDSTCAMTRAGAGVEVYFWST